MIAGIVAGQMIQQSGGGGSDPYFSYVVSLLHFNGPNASTSFLDQKGKSWSAIGSGQLSSSRSKFGTASFSGNGSGSGVLGVNSSDFDFGSGDLTIEAWVYIAADSAPDADGARGANIFSTWDAGSGASALTGYVINISGDSSTTGTGIAFDTWSGGSGTLLRAAASISKNVWHHIAVTVSSGVRRIFLDGVLLTASVINISGGYTDVNSLGSAPRIGLTQRSSYPLSLNGNIDDLRITKGLARYTSDFSIPSAQFPDS